MKTNRRQFIGRTAQSAAMVANCVAYSADGKRIGDISLDAISDVLERPDTFVWVGLIEPDEALLEKLQEEFGLHDLAIEDAHNAHQRPKIEAYGEAYLGGSYKMFDAKVWYTDDYGDTGDDAWYTELNASFELPAGLTLALHVGRSFGDYWDQVASDAEDDLETSGIDGDYTDWSIGLGYTVDHFDLSLRYVDTDTDSALQINNGAFANDSRVVFSVSTSFPWTN